MEGGNRTNGNGLPGPNSGGARAAAARTRNVGPPASYADVMREQMEYLLAHAAAACHPGCSDCARLEQVRRYLLRPFC